MVLRSRCPGLVVPVPVSYTHLDVYKRQVQRERTSDLIFTVPQLISTLSGVLVLLPGDVIFTGTPAGVGIARQPPRFLAPGDVLESWIEGIGTIRNTCRASSH